MIVNILYINDRSWMNVLQLTRARQLMRESCLAEELLHLQERSTSYFHYRLRACSICVQRPNSRLGK